MRLTFLGTSAGECYPALWCHCVNCEYARKAGGRNIRLNSCAVLDEDVLLDMNAYCFPNAMRYGVDVTRVTTLLVTHEHQDHFYPQNLVWRSWAWSANGPVDFDAPVEDITAHQCEMGPRFSPVPFLHIYGSAAVKAAMAANPRIDMNALAEKHRMDFSQVKPGQTFTAGEDLTVTPVLSRHGTPGCTFNYIIERGGKTLLYALDTGGYDEEMWEVLRAHRYDCVVMEGTYGNHGVDFDFHMNQRMNLQMLDTFNRLSLWKAEPRLVLSHMAPHWTPPYDVYAPEMASYGITVAYDGMQLDI